MRQLRPARPSLACASAADSCWVLTPSERAAAANTGDAESTEPAANNGRSVALTRAVLTQLAVFHAPDDLIIAVCAGSGRRPTYGPSPSTPATSGTCS